VAGRLFKRVNLTFVAECRDYITREVSAEYVDKWQGRLTKRDRDLLMPHIEAELMHQGYEVT
jgi:hypothetical protein